MDVALALHLEIQKKNAFVIKPDHLSTYGTLIQLLSIYRNIPLITTTSDRHQNPIHNGNDKIVFESVFWPSQQQQY